MLPFSVDDLKAAVSDGSVTARCHPDLPYTIYNYSPETAYSNRWNDVTLNCRGLILDNDYNIVARGFKKFFNLGQVDLPIQFDTPVEVMDKVDGSLGILYPEPTVIKWDGGRNTPVTHHAIATRGSFTSEQAIHATEIWDEKYAGLEVPEGLTFLFEIVFPANRIVLDYSGMDDLVLLGAVENEYGYYYGPEYARAVLQWPGPVVEVMPFNTLSEANAHLTRKNAEGFVIRSHNFMVKLKQPDYLTLHRIVTNLSPKMVWEQLSAGRTVTDICRGIPDEFYDYVNSMAEPLLMQFDKLYEECHTEFNNITERVGVADRKKFAIEAQKAKHHAAMFTLLDGKPIKDYLWKQVRPKNENGLSAFNSAPR